MAGDEKHARELIAEARTYMASSQNQHGRGGLVDQLADALEAALPGDDDWEYRCKLNSADPNYEHEWVEVKTGHQCGGVLQRRRPAGPWEAVND